MAEIEQGRPKVNATTESDPSVTAWVRASADNGSTSILIQRVLRLLLAGNTPKSIGYVTASKAAVVAFREDLSQAIAQWRQMDDAALEQAISRLTGRGADLPQLQRARKQVETAITFGGDGICIEDIEVLRSHPRKLDHLLIDAREQLNDEQWTTIRDLAEAGPGSGANTKRSIFSVDDGSQSIFQFRPNDSTPHLQLDHFFRSPSSTLDAVDAIFRRDVSNAPLLVGALVVPERKTAEGVLIKSASVLWMEVAKRLRTDWSIAYQIPPEKWEEMIAGAYSRAGFDEVILTPRSGDHGRDIIATRNGIGCIKIIGSVKAYKPGHLVTYDDVRALAFVLSGERDASKGIITTTSEFPPLILSDPFIAPLTPTRLELMNGERLQKWLAALLEGER